MELKDVNNTLHDLARAGLVIGKKVITRSMADERRLNPELVSNLVNRLHPDSATVELAEIIEETESTKTLRLVPTVEPLPPFRAGQFVSLALTVDGVPTSRPYSISSPPSRMGYYDITVRKMPDGFVSVYLCEEAKVGDTFELSGPAGCFYYEPLMDSDDLVFLAGGSGITPFMSIISNAIDVSLDIKMHVIYGSRLPDDVIFWNELSELACRYENLKVDLVISEPPAGYEGACGVLDTEMIETLLGGIEGKTFYMCGPEAMYGLCLDSLAALGVPSRRIRKELAGPPPDITAVEGWPTELKGDTEFTVQLEGTPRKLNIRCGEPLLNALERDRVEIDNLCRSGECGVCRTRLIAGEVFMPPGVTMRKSDAAFGYIHPCMSYPTTDIIIRT